MLPSALQVLQFYMLTQTKSIDDSMIGVKFGRQRRGALLDQVAKCNNFHITPFL